MTLVMNTESARALRKVRASKDMWQQQGFVMTNFQCEDIIRRKEQGGAGVNKGMLGLSLRCQKVIQYVEKNKAGMKKTQKEMRKRNDVAKKRGHLFSQVLTGLRGVIWAELAEVPAVHARS